MTFLTLVCAQVVEATAVPVGGGRAQGVVLTAVAQLYDGDEGDGNPKKKGKHNT